MLESIVKTLFLLVFLHGIGNKAIASVPAKEIYLKEMNERIGELLKQSAEANYFLEEDLTEAITTLADARLNWVETMSTRPFLIVEEGRSTIVLSNSYTFFAQEEEQVKLVLEILFHLKRQLEGTLLPVPELRMKLFAKKFAPTLLSTASSCSFSLYPIPLPLTPAQREKFTNELLSLMRSKGYHFQSKWATKVIWMNARSTTDAECGGNNRNVLTLKAFVTEITSRKALDLGEGKAHSCGFAPVKTEKALKKIIKTIKTNLPKCINAFWN